MSDKEQMELLAPVLTSADEGLIRHAYDQALSRVARLSCYGASGEIDGLNAEITGRQTQLAIDDMIHLAISLRRLTDGVSVNDAANNITVPKIILVRRDRVVEDIKIIGSYKLRTIINKIVHSNRIEIFNFGFQISADTPRNVFVRQLFDRETHRIRPVCVLSADTNAIFVFNVLALCEATSKLLEIATDAAADSHIFLEDFYR